MDQDRWVSSWVPAQQPAKKSSQNSSPVNRYQSDMERAKALRQGLKRNKALTNEDLRLGMEGLERADGLVQRGELEQALSVYESALELLIRFLKSDASIDPAVRVDMQVLEARVSVALSEAEEVKRQLRGSAQRQQPASEPSKQPEPSTAAARSLSSIASVLSWRKSSSPEKPKSPTQNTNIPVTRKTSKTNAATSALPAPSNSLRQQPSSPRRKKQPTNRTAPVRKSTRWDYDKDPFVQTIKSDMYVDPSDLQDTTWDDIAGLATAKQALQESAILPLVRPDLFTGLRKPQNILLYGPPGTGKTMLVRAVAKESSCLLFVCTASAMTSKWHGEGEKIIRTLFRIARDVAPSIVFVDELDALLSNRKSEGEHEASRRFKTEFMVQMDGIVKNPGEAQHQVLVLACTNCPWDIDSAVLRRFPRRIHVPLPDEPARKALVSKLLEKAVKHNLTARQISSVARKTEGFSCSDITSIASEAAFGPLRSLGGMDAIRGVQAEDVRPISLKDFDNAIQLATKSVTQALLDRYDEWAQQQAGTG